MAQALRGIFKEVEAKEMQIRDIMNRYVDVIERDADVRAAAIKMRDTNTNVIPVCDGPLFAGILTDRDIAVRLAAEGYDATRTLVGEIMTRDLTYCFEDQKIEDAAIVMQFHQISRLPVLDRNYQLVGIVSLNDISSSLEGRVDPVAAQLNTLNAVETEPGLAAARR
jgi:CBS domain-containing protein